MLEKHKIWDENWNLIFLIKISKVTKPVCFHETRFLKSWGAKQSTSPMIITKKINFQDLINNWGDSRAFRKSIATFNKCLAFLPESVNKSGLIAEYQIISLYFLRWTGYTNLLFHILSSSFISWKFFCICDLKLLFKNSCYNCADYWVQLRESRIIKKQF